ncbi:uncharacterized protein LOC124183593 isoform X1 [Neodiprion fabricii]|uniref:uncharacterized protein LOC124183593 isoform X1 n=1 Tax=Neodiprion fabricii TaxID=2872261 RepID=UPI001ED955B9|nr:uncharacterized protein LOC124183593 isoform X1 [Neodiprion fabricii]
MIGNQLRSAVVLSTFLAVVAGKSPPPPGAPWAKFVTKPAFARSLGPPPLPEVETMSIPYIPKPSLFPKFVDPRMMIAKKTDMLSKMFGGLGPAMGPFPGFGLGPYAGYGLGPYATNPAGMYGSEDINMKGTTDLDSTSDGIMNNDLPILYASGFGEGGEFSPNMKYSESLNGLPTGELSNVKRGLFGPMGPKSPFLGPFSPVSAQSATSGDAASYTDASSSFIKRGFPGPNPVKNGEPSSSATEPPPPYSSMHVIPEEVSETGEKEVSKESPLDKIFSGSKDSKTSKDLTKRMVTDGSVPKEYLPGMYGPMSPFFGTSGPAFGPSAAFGPGAFISKKSMFLDTLFKNLATSTESPVTDVPVPKSTIVPPGFWFPETVIPDPASYDTKVATFLDKLFDSLKLNASTAAGDSPYETSMSPGFPGAKTRSLPFGYSAAGSSPYTRSLPATDHEAVITAKDQIVSSIIGELSVLKDDMVATFNDLIAYQKNASTPPPGSKPFKPFAPIWPGATAVADIGTLPYKRRMIILAQVFDMLTELQTNITATVNEAIKSSYEEEPEPATTPKPEDGGLSLAVLDAIQAKLNELDTIASTKLTPKGFSTKFSRALSDSPTSFWVAYPGSTNARRNSLDEPDIPRRSEQGINDDIVDTDSFIPGKDSREIKMQMHQGYQSLPPGTIESIQAGGGSVPGHEGGGVKFLIKMPAKDMTTDGQSGGQVYQNYPAKWQDWSNNMEKEYQNNRHHHHFHH